MSEKKVRKASHAGSWYTSNGTNLNKQLNEWLQKAEIVNGSAVRALICPHAGYSYSGPTAAWSYKNMDKSKIKRVFVLGPSHHAYLTTCALSLMDEYETPLGNIPLDLEVIKELESTGEFDKMKKSVDEAEHSIEMQLPYIAKMMSGSDFRLVPVLVGSLSKSSEEAYGKIFAKYLDDPNNFFVISSDFCHWGDRFDYQHYNSKDGPIYKSIEKLDRTGMELIEVQDAEGFHQYLKKFKNTICGRHPIGVLLQTITASKLKYKVEFVSYAQSNQATSEKDFC